MCRWTPTARELGDPRQHGSIGVADDPMEAMSRPADRLVQKARLTEED
jgi:hypothetical protein